MGIVINPAFYPVIRALYPVIPAKAGIQKVADDNNEPKTAANALCQP